MVAELGDDHLGDRSFRRQAARHDTLRRKRLHDGARAATADVFRAARHQHPPLRRDYIELLADILSDLRHRAAAAARTERARGLDDPLHPRQMRRQAPTIAMARPIRSAARSTLDDHRRLVLRRVEHALRDLHVFQR